MKPSEQSTKNEPTDLPAPGPKKQNPKELDKMLDKALEDSMIASDPPAVTQPDVKKEPGNEPGSSHDSRGRYDSGKQVGHKV
jgi:hypothetical protein